MVCYARALIMTPVFVLSLLSLINGDGLETPLVQKTPLTVSDGNWSDIMSGEWMVEFMAPWCPACESFRETWGKLASWSSDLDINVGVVDVTENPVLSGRFLVTALPTIYHIRNGEFRQYLGGREENDLISYVDDKRWSDIDPVTWYWSPSSYHMGGVGMFFKLSMFVRTFYNAMVNDYGIPEWGCYVIFAIATIIAGLVLGLLFVLCCDMMFPPKRSVHRVPAASADDDSRDDRSDILDDSKSADGDTTTTRQRIGPQKTE